MRSTLTRFCDSVVVGIFVHGYIFISWCGTRSTTKTFLKIAARSVYSRCFASLICFSGHNTFGLWDCLENKSRINNSARRSSAVF